MNNIFIGYQSKYSGAFDLLDSFKYPKMCASKSLNLTNGVNYYRGQNPMKYDINIETSYGDSVVKMGERVSWLFQDGSAATGVLGSFTKTSKTFDIFTIDEALIGKHRTILRGCSVMNELIELYLYAEVLANSYPDFVTDLETVHII